MRWQKIVAYFSLPPKTHNTNKLPRRCADWTGPTAVVFRSRENMCINSIYACREEFCPHLRMFQQKLAAGQNP